MIISPAQAERDVLWFQSNSSLLTKAIYESTNIESGEGVPDSDGSLELRQYMPFSPRWSSIKERVLIIWVQVEREFVGSHWRHFSSRSARWVYCWEVRKHPCPCFIALTDTNFGFFTVEYLRTLPIAHGSRSRSHPVKSNLLPQDYITASASATELIPKRLFQVSLVLGLTTEAWVSYYVEVVLKNSK